MSCQGGCGFVMVRLVLLGVGVRAKDFCVVWCVGWWVGFRLKKLRMSEVIWSVDSDGVSNERFKVGSRSWVRVVGLVTNVKV